VVGYVLAVNVVTVGLIALTLCLTPIPGSDLGYFATLLACCVGYGEASRRIERLRRQHSGTPHVDLNSVWMFAGVLLLHPALVAVLIATFHVHRWVRVAHRMVYRVTFSASAGMLSAFAASGLLALVGHYHAFHDMPHNAANLGLVAAAAVLCLVLNLTLVSVAVALSSTNPSLRTTTADLSDYALEAASLGLAALLAWALVDWAAMALAVIGVTLVLHGKVLIRQLKEAARTDPKTGLLNTAAWYEAGRREIERAGRQGSTVGVLVIDLDHFKRVNDDYGHMAGDEVLVAVAETIANQVRGYDVVGRFGGEEFLALLPDIDGAHLVQAAERIRREIAELVLPVDSHQGVVLFRGLTASIGIAVFPQHGDLLEKLLRAADGALFAAKAAGRNQIQLATVPAKKIIPNQRLLDSPTREPIRDPLD
jgi:diguanylate cyclase (GGDEF)-like protein